MKQRRKKERYQGDPRRWGSIKANRSNEQKKSMGSEKHEESYEKQVEQKENT
jgi:hypothetical protein